MTSPTSAGGGVVLLNCPCCDGPAESDWRQPYAAISDGRIGNAAAIYCTKCGVQISFCYADARDQSEEDIQNYIRELWNTRTPLTSQLATLTAEVERLREVNANIMRTEEWLRQERDAATSREAALREALQGLVDALDTKGAVSFIEVAHAKTAARQALAGKGEKS